MTDDLDITDSLAPKSDQLDNVELQTPRTFTIERVSRNNAEQPWNFHLKDFPRVWRPGKSMLRVIAEAWGNKASAYVGQSVTLYRDPSVRFGNDVTGGTRISHMTGIDKPLKVSLMVSRGKFAPFTVQPLTAPAPKPDTTEWVDALTHATTLEALQDTWKQAAAFGVTSDPDVLAAKETRKKELS